MQMVYLDNAATTKTDEKVIKAIIKSYEENYGNPSSTHRLGQKAKGMIEKTRDIIASGINCKSNEIIFTSGGTEGNNLVLKGFAFMNQEKGKHIITTKVEHPTVLETCKYLEKKGFEVTYLDVNRDGVISVEDLENKIRKDTILVSIMYANNETGVKMPIEEIGELLEKKSIFFHTDAVQGIGHEKIDVQKLKIKALTCSGHKIYGVKGTGFIYLNKNYSIEKEIWGGSQEINKRGGTENLEGIVGLGVAFQEVCKNIEKNNMVEKNLLNYLEDKIQKEIKNVEINGKDTDRIGTISNITLKGCDIQTMLIALDMRGICVSGGSACMSGAQKESHVLKAMGRNELELKSSLRISVGKYNTKEDIDYFVENLKKIVEIERS